MQVKSLEEGVVALVPRDNSRWQRFSQETGTRRYTCAICHKGDMYSPPMKHAWLCIHPGDGTAWKGKLLCDHCFIETAGFDDSKEEEPPKKPKP